MTYLWISFFLQACISNFKFFSWWKWKKRFRSLHWKYWITGSKSDYSCLSIWHAFDLCVRNKKSHLFIFFNAFNIPLFVIICYYLLLLFAFRFSFLATAFWSNVWQFCWNCEGFFICVSYSALLRPTFTHCQGDSLTKPMFKTTLYSYFAPRFTGSLATRLGS